MIKKILTKFKKYNLKNASIEFTNEILKEYNFSRPLGPQKQLCYAPFKNIYFGHYGKASACCYNRNYVLGKFPQESIKDIWFGEKSEKLRRIVSENNLDFGCLSCKSHILSKNFDANKSKQYDEQTLNKNKYPSVLELELSNTCNLECEMCNGNFSSSIRKNRENLPPLKKIYDGGFVKQLEEFIPHLEEIKFYGGEPFLIDIYYEIWELVIELKPTIRLSVQTNATVLNKRIKSLLNRGNFHLNISIDSLQKDNYEIIRKNASYEKVFKNLEWFIDYCKRKQNFIGLSACLLKNNWHELPSFIEFCNKCQIQIYFHFVYFPKNVSIESLSKKELNNTIEELSKSSFQSNTSLAKKNIKHFWDTINQIKALQTKKPLINKKKIKTTKEAICLIENFIEVNMQELSEFRKKNIVLKLKEVIEIVNDNQLFISLFNKLSLQDSASLLGIINKLETLEIIELKKLLYKKLHQDSF